MMKWTVAIGIAAVIAAAIAFDVRFYTPSTIETEWSKPIRREAAPTAEEVEAKWRAAEKAEKARQAARNAEPATDPAADAPADPVLRLGVLIKLAGAPCGNVRAARFLANGNIVGECTNGITYAATKEAGGWQLRRL